MADRRPLTQGLKGKSDATKVKEEAFVFGAQNKPVDAEPQPQPPASAVAVKLSPSAARVPFTSRIRGDINQALKRASLGRQLQNVEPNTVQEILEEALEPWLFNRGYLT